MPTPESTVVTPATLRDWPLPEPGAGKDGRGHLLVVGGSSGTPGAVLLAGEAALRAGGGKLQILTVQQVTESLAVAVPEAMVLGLPANGNGSIHPAAAGQIVTHARQVDMVLVGPGFSDPEDAVRLMASAVPDLTVPLVVDALASAFLTEHPEGLHHLEGRVVVTMNPTELARTAGCDEDDVELDPLAHASAVAARSQVIVVCGGTQKFVVTPEGRSWVIQGGGPGLGVSGSGDVQAGIVSGLLARGAEPAQAAVWGAYAHARAGERLAASVGLVGYLARELPGQVPMVLSELQ